jgi:8-oxo-dGTP pyrophosphatase MutT (NUDIX family)
VPTLDDITRALAARSPTLIPEGGHRRAAVAMILRSRPGGPEVLFIERARQQGDPWSGHMAFPGGKVDPTDAEVRAAAERETLEEVGISLDSALALGRLDDKAGNPTTAPKLVISAWVYQLDDAPEPRPNYEVADVFWFPVRDLLDPERHVGYRMKQYDIDMPGILVGAPDRHIVWGLTYSFLESFFVAIDRPLPNRWSPELTARARGMDREA